MHFRIPGPLVDTLHVVQTRPLRQAYDRSCALSALENFGEKILGGISKLKWMNSASGNFWNLRFFGEL
jgi:hypothetical protein